mmetsp:Transcript_10519/g.25687  ORF Transcript_10519/g.25687 Transcript_10519/m.25687 type:complete len:132 (-) Transcript_10519:79-474(-)
MGADSRRYLWLYSGAPVLVSANFAAASDEKNRWLWGAPGTAVAQELQQQPQPPVCVKPRREMAWETEAAPGRGMFEAARRWRAREKWTEEVRIMSEDRECCSELEAEQLGAESRFFAEERIRKHDKRQRTK